MGCGEIDVGGKELRRIFLVVELPLDRIGQSRQGKWRDGTWIVRWQRLAVIVEQLGNAELDTDVLLLGIDDFGKCSMQILIEHGPLAGGLQRFLEFLFVLAGEVAADEGQSEKEPVAAAEPGEW